MDDATWWNNVHNTNPYGGKVWPSSLGITNYLLKELMMIEDNPIDFCNYEILELGCGNGLISIALAAAAAATASSEVSNVRITATDISDTCLQLTRLGWEETSTKIRKQQQRLHQREELLQNKVDSERRSNPTSVHKENPDVHDGGGDNHSLTSRHIGSLLDVAKFDIFSKQPLPISNKNGNKKSLVIAAAMLYDSDLAKMLARRVYEACYVHDAWVIIGDDDTGIRDNGREIFLQELVRLEEQEQQRRNSKVSRTWISSIVRNTNLKWNEKQIHILQMNSPNIVMDDAESIPR